MRNDISDYLSNHLNAVEIDLFDVDDPRFLTKYNALSAIWSRLIQLEVVTIVIRNNHVALRLLTSAEDSDVVLNTYLDDVRNVFTRIQGI